MIIPPGAVPPMSRNHHPCLSCIGADAVPICGQMYNGSSTLARQNVPGFRRHVRDRELVVGLLWHSVNSGNLGIGALTQSQIAIVESIAAELDLSVRFHVLGWSDPWEPYAVGENVLAVPLKAVDFIPYSAGLHAAVRRCDLVCDIGAGDSFADIYGAKRFMYQAMSKAIVLLAGRPLVLSPQTIGPFKRPWAARVARQLIRRCRAVVVRDELSLAFVNDLDATIPVITATDVAFRLPYDPAHANGDGRIDVGINVSGLLFNGGYDRNNMFGLSVDYPELIRALLRHFTGVPNCRVHVVGHVLAEDQSVEDDRSVALALAREFPDVVVAPRFRSPSEAKSYIATMDFVSGSRMHACIAALSSGVPVLPLAYSRKFAGLFGSLGYPHVADCRKETTEAAVAKVIDAFENRVRLRTAVAAANRKARERLTAYEDVLRDCLSAAACRIP